jgi:hypothetical protein
MSFVPTGALRAPNNGRGVLVLGNKIYYTELVGDDGFGPTDFIHAAPFNGGAGGPDNPAWALPNPRPRCGVQDLAYHDGFIYALTGISGACVTLQVFKKAVASPPSAPWSAPVTIPNFPNPDGFTILVNNGVVTFLINEFDGSCTYNEFNSTTGAATGNGFVVSGFTFCTGVDTLDSDTDGTHVLYFSHFELFSATPGSISSATLTPSFGLIGPNPIQTLGDGWGFVEDISLVHGFAGTPGSANCHGQTVSELALRYGGMANAASALGFASVAGLQDAIRAFCGD